MSLLKLLSEEERKKFEDVESKLCKYCNTRKPLSFFPKRKDNHGGYDHRCRDCKKKRDSVVKKIKEDPPYEPTCCENCGAVPSRDSSAARGHRFQGLCTDHDPETNEFRGYLCHLCNRSLGGLGDTIESVQRMLDYLIKAKLRNEERRNNELFH